MLMKRATKKLRKAGISDLEVNKAFSGFGFTLFDPALRYLGQTSTVYHTPDEAVAAAVNGTRPRLIMKEYA